jgi:hypothetical protein
MSERSWASGHWQVKRGQGRGVYQAMEGVAHPKQRECSWLSVREAASLGYESPRIHVNFRMERCRLTRCLEGQPRLSGWLRGVEGTVRRLRRR